MHLVSVMMACCGLQLLCLVFYHAPSTSSNAASYMPVNAPSVSDDGLLWSAVAVFGALSCTKHKLPLLHLTTQPPWVLQTNSHMLSGAIAMLGV